MKKMWLASLLVAMLMVLTACTESATSDEQGDSTVGESVEVISVTDGDTMKVMYKGEQRNVRFLLIDAPEMHHKTYGEQPYGKEAQQLNRTILNEAKSVSIEFDETGDREDKYDRLLAYVYADGQSVQEQLIESGYVRVGYVYNKQAAYLEDYEKAQEKAKSENRGIWQYPGYVTERGFVKEKVPNWSVGMKLPASGDEKTNKGSSATISKDKSEKSGQSCTIKGNINDKGNKNYFIVGDANYEQVNEEELFCSEEDAEAAGFKRAG